VDARAHARQLALGRVCLLETQRKRERGARRLEGEEAAVARPIDDAAARLRRQPAD
jgi:hypothetical protein